MADSFNLFIASGIFHPESGGPATYLYELLPRLQALDWEIRALIYGAGSTDTYPYPLTRIPRRVMPLRLAHYAYVSRSLMDWADLIYLHTLGLPLIGVRKPCMVKIVGDQAWERAVRRGWISPTEDIDTFQTRRYGLAVTLQKGLRSREIRAMDGVIVPSEYLKRMVIGWGVDAAKVQVIYNALPTQATTGESVGAWRAMPLQAAPYTISQSDARARLNLADEPLLLTAGRLLPWKGVDHLIAALTRVPDVKLLVAGDGPMAAPLRQQAERLGVANRVRFLGNVPRDTLALYMKAADYVALYSGYEGLSHTLLESLRAGTPVIASDKGGNPEVVQHGVNGLLVPYLDVEALAASLAEALSPVKRTALARNSHVGMERFDFARMVEQTDTALRALI